MLYVIYWATLSYSLQYYTQLHAGCCTYVFIAAYAYNAYTFNTLIHNLSVYIWMNEWMIKWMNEWMNEYMNEWMNAWMNEWMNEWIHECINEWMNAWINEWIHTWMNPCHSGVGHNSAERITLSSTCVCLRLRNYFVLLRALRDMPAHAQRSYFAFAAVATLCSIPVLSSFALVLALRARAGRLHCPDCAHADPHNLCPFPQWVFVPIWAAIYPAVWRPMLDV
jgi:hypothetical protein